jgi:hypothetical protein
MIKPESYLGRLRSAQLAQREAIECRLILRGIIEKLDLVNDAPEPSFWARVLGRETWVSDSAGRQAGRAAAGKPLVTERRTTRQLVQQALDLATVRLSRPLPWDPDKEPS